MTVALFFTLSQLLGFSDSYQWPESSDIYVRYTQPSVSNKKTTLFQKKILLDILYRKLCGLSSSWKQLANNSHIDLFFFFTLKCLPFVSHRFPWSAIHKCTSIRKSWLQTCAISILETCSLWTPQITGFQSLAQYVPCSLSLLVNTEVLHDNCEQHQDNFWL